MKDFARMSDAAPGGATDPRWELAQRVAASRHFERSARMRRFLLFICERSLSSRGDQLTEYQIGTAVFGRKPDYSPNDDNIVRVEARSLRKRLQDYFDQDGRDEPLVMVVPKGGYVAEFRPREVAEVVALATRKTRLAFAAAPWALVAFLAAVLAFLLLRDRSAGTTGNSPFLSELLDSASPTLLVLADSNFALYQDLTGRDLRLEDYLGQRYLADEQQTAFSLVARRQYTSLADANLAVRIAGPYPPSRFPVRFARSLQVRDFHSGNAILLGGRRANPWVELFEPQLNFTVAYDTVARRVRIVNKSPRPGEASHYVIESSVDKTGRAYGLVSLVPNLSRSGRVLILQGLNMEGTEAAGEFVLNPRQVERLRAALNGTKGGLPTSFEVLVRLHAIGGSAKDTEIIAVRSQPMVGEASGRDGVTRHTQTGQSDVPMREF